MSELLVNTIKKADGTGSLTVPAETGTVVTTASPSLGRRNLIINGAMQVAQRGTSSTSGGYVSLDRWRVNQSGASTTFSQETFTVGEEIGQSRNYARFAVSTGNDNAGIQQRIENVTSVPGGETITISFWAKGTNPGGGSLIAGYGQNFGSGGSADVGAVIESFTLTTNWTKYEITFTNPSYSGKTIGTSSYWQLTIGQGSDTSTDAWTLDITNVQLEVGSVATPFEHRSYGEELALCMRYFQNVIDNVSGLSSVCLVSVCYASGDVYCPYNYPVEMRAGPSVTFSDASDFRIRHSNNITATATGTQGTFTKKHGCFYFLGTATAGSGGWIRAQADAGAYIYLNAEL